MLLGHSLADPFGRLIAVDPQVCEILQRSERELIGMTYADLTYPDDRSRNIDLVGKLKAADGLLTIKKRYLRPNGSTVWANVQVSRLGGADRGGLVGTITMVDAVANARDPETQWRLAKRALDILNHRRVEIGEGIFSDHSFAILLELYLAEAEGRVVDQDELSGRVMLARPVVERWLLLLQTKQLVERSTWSRGCCQLTLLGTAKLERLLDMQRHC